jgi:hypothetical protein
MNPINIPEKRERILTYVTIIGLIISTIVGVVGTVILAWENTELAKEANELSRQALQYQAMQSNYSTTIITPQDMFIVLDSTGKYTSGDAIYSDQPAGAFGWLNGTIKIISPSYGTIDVFIKDFTIRNEYNQLNSHKINLTHVMEASGFKTTNTEIPVIEGYNGDIKFGFAIIGTFYPDISVVDSIYNSEQVVALGDLLLEARFTTQTGFVFSKDFSINVNAIVKNY